MRKTTARDGTFRSFFANGDGKTFTTVGSEQNGDYLPPQDRGVRAAMTVGGAENATARFGFFANRTDEINFIQIGTFGVIKL